MKYHTLTLTQIRAQSTKYLQGAEAQGRVGLAQSPAAGAEAAAVVAPGDVGWPEKGP
jgi:hypothetical protein